LVGRLIGGHVGDPPVPKDAPSVDQEDRPLGNSLEAEADPGVLEYSVEFCDPLVEITQERELQVVGLCESIEGVTAIDADTYELGSKACSIPKSSLNVHISLSQVPEKANGKNTSIVVPCLVNSLRERILLSVSGRSNSGTFCPIRGAKTTKKGEF